MSTCEQFESLTPASKVLVIDGHSMAFRAFYALPVESFVNGEGQHTNAVHGFTSMLLTMIRQHEPTHVVVAFDLSGPTFRSEEYAEYKGGRAKTPEEFSGQIGLIQRVLDALNIAWITVEGFEADDIIATVATQGEAQGADVVVVSGDRDAFQLITEKVSVLYPKKGISDIPPMTAADIEAKYGVRPERYRDLAALVGETADNLPGVPKVGPKTAAKWIAEFGSVEGIIEHADEIKGKAGENLRAALDDVKRNYRLNGLTRDMTLPTTIDEMRRAEPDFDAVDELFDELEFKTLRERVRTGLAPREEAVVLEAPAAVVVRSAEDLAALVGEEGTPVALTLDEDPRLGEVLSLATETSRGTVVLSRLDEPTTTAVADVLRERAADILATDVKGLTRRLEALGYALPEGPRDLGLEAFVLRPGAKGYTPELLVADLTDQDPGDKPKKPTAAALKKESAEEAEANAAPSLERLSRIAWLLHPVAAELTGRLDEHAWAAGIVNTLEVPLSRVLLQMERTGIAVDLQRLDELEADFSARVEDAKARAGAIVGETVNLSSPKQLQEVLFEKLALPKTRKIASGYTTDAESLSELMTKLEPESSEFEFMGRLLQYREFTKLGQFVTLLKESVTAASRVHTTYAQTAAATGRLSSTGPNLQNIPVRTAEGRLLRSVFVADPAFEGLMTADYSQIEMRIMAHLSGDEALIEAFRSGEDLHNFVGSQVFDVEPAEVTPAMRSKVKAMSYGLAYGLSSFGLSKQLKISVDEARRLMKSYFDRFGGVRDYLRGVVEQAKKDGYTTTIGGRRRYLPDLTSSNRQVRENAERIALNSPIQGTAADIIKKAMLDVQARIESEGLESRMLLQVHDELVVEVAAGEREAVERILREEMGRAAELSVPLDVNVGFGRDWNEAAH
ncbi:DNA polymerase I [Falsarthrobacter nasiphocae]|uniref:DNA polymerase I n=1 Tax=Falsarthrobacter nasiphocae TaxID=189863 RepID=A0AAE4C5M2_9MICC|nr:DNA polymerase I [Falsarthrobacter nasiphocae]MDR6891217.1 DNA polymerase-1 [Falsarthrobacter nasiphocae]